MHVLTLKVDDYTYEFHMLNVGDHFPRFGGSRQGLIAGEGQPKGKRTASLVLRRISKMGSTDTEYDIGAIEPWQFLCRCINDPDMNATGELPDWMVNRLNEVSEV
jgi:hypothetical protein